LRTASGVGNFALLQVNHHEVERPDLGTPLIARLSALSAAALPPGGGDGGTAPIVADSAPSAPAMTRFPKL
jgi:hypothetical protein